MLIPSTSGEHTICVGPETLSPPEAVALTMPVKVLGLVPKSSRPKFTPEALPELPAITQPAVS